MIQFLKMTFLLKISKSKESEAISALHRLRGEDYDITSELNELKSADEKSKNENVNAFAALGKRVGLKSLFIGLGLMFFQQLSGINAVIFYAGSIFGVSIFLAFYC